MNLILKNKIKNVGYIIALAASLNGVMAMDPPQQEDNINLHDYDLTELAFGYEGDFFPETFGSVLGNICDSLTPKLEIDSEDSTFTKVSKAVVNEGLSEGTKYAIKMTGGGLVKNAYGIYSNPEATHRRGEGTIARNAGNQVKETIESLPGGEYIISAANIIKPEGTDSLAEAVFRVACPASETKIEGTTNQIAGSFVKTMVISSIPGGKYLAKGAGFLGQRLFGTDTFTEGALNFLIGGEEAQGDAIVEGQDQENESDTESFYTQESDSDEESL